MRCTEPNAHWKDFHENPMTHSEAHYLMTIYDLGSARANDLVKALNIAAPTVSQALKSLVKKGWLLQNSDKSFSLKPERKEIVAQIETNKALLMDFFVTQLGLQKNIADRDSCKIEHLLSPEAAVALEDFLHEQHTQKQKKGGLPVLN
ncbi:metal-dependent transcriptional regulator [Candidatus Peregrinibacteria bacterium]|nr:metal-dependent transcriptional regulator [bacterium]NCQ55825.1 metal-dependent transcriptional regulator [Candidatus Parcubacteria bacterium]NCS67892.1 metal-dependent transcriptional regulator [Candidatus Peregrinibacteria bacterium]